VKSIRRYFDHLRISLLAIAVGALCYGLLSFQFQPAARAAQAREVRVVPTDTLVGQNVNVAVTLLSQGNENAVGFTLNYNTAIFSNPVVALGSDAAGAVFNTNTDPVGGRVGVTLALPTGQAFQAGTKQLVVMTLTVAANAPAGPSIITFGNSPVASEVSDALANALTATFTPGAVNVVQPNPTPTLTSLSPTSATAGSAGFTLTATGANFVNTSVVQWNGSARTTTFVSATQLTAAIPAQDVASSGTAQVTVLNPTPGGGTSAPQTFTINNPTPAITTVTPTATVVGGAAVALTVNGTGFIAGSKIQYNGTDLTTAFVSATQLTATIPAGNFAAAGTANVTVVNPAPGGGTSNAVSFAINNPAPTITTVTPTAALIGSPDVVITVNGTGFIAGSKARFNATDLTTTFVSATQLTATIPAGNFAAVGTANVTVVNPAPGGGTSNAVSFAVNNPSPTVTTLSPTSATAGGAGFTLTVNGTNFINGSVIRFNGSDRATTFVSGTQLTAAIGASDVATAAVVPVTVFTPTPGGGTSSAVNFTINNPTPAVTTLNPASALAGSPAFTLTVNGTGFVTGATVQWNGVSRTTTFVSATQLTAAIVAADVASAGSANVTVVNPTPGGGTSNAVTFTITQPQPAPTITSLSPAFAVAGGAQFTLTVNGTNFAATSVVRWNDSDRVTTFVSATQVRATIPATDIAAQGVANVKVFTPAPGGGVSNALPFTVGSQSITSVSAASYQSNELAAESIIAGFGVNLATAMLAATTQPLPTTLAGSKISVRDSAGVERLAPLYFVSSGQVNYQIPPSSADGAGSVVATSGDNKISVGTVQIARVAPGVFTANSDGNGVAAALILRVKSGNAQTFEPIVRFDSAQNKFVSSPVDLGPETDQLFLILYGTGFRFRTMLSAMSVTIGGVNAQVAFADAAPGFTGLDQANVMIPRSLIGRGEVDVVMTVNGKTANTVRLNIK
jgi:uncharacterized protein (TIGR03437 family)